MEPTSQTCIPASLRALSAADASGAASASRIASLRRMMSCMLKPADLLAFPNPVRQPNSVLNQNQSKLIKVFLLLFLQKKKTLPLPKSINNSPHKPRPIHQQHIKPRPRRPPAGMLPHQYLGRRQ